MADEVSVISGNNLSRRTYAPTGLFGGVDVSWLTR